MKRYIRSSQVPNSYLYIFKHGIGPGTIPSDVQIVKIKDLPNGYTAVWLNRFLTYDELKQYDIPSETRINELLGRIGYCQKNGDVVPCDDVEACGNITASLHSFNSDSYNTYEDYDDAKHAADMLAKQGYETDINHLVIKDGVERYEVLYRPRDIGACGDVTASIQLPIDPKDKIYDLYQIAIEWCDNSKVDQILINNGTSPDSKFIVDENTNVMQAYIDLVDYIRNNVSPDILDDEEYALVYGDEVNACDKVTAATRPHPPIPSGWERVPEGDDDEGNWGTIFRELPNNGGYIWLDLYRDDNDRRYYELQIGYRNPDGTIGDIHPLISKEFYRLGDAVKYAEDRINRESDSEDIESCDKVETSDTKYFANMVNASSEDLQSYGYEVRGYYDENRRGLAESEWVADVSEANEIANDYANKGYYLEIRNNFAGTIIDIDSEGWFENFYPDGIGDL